MSADSSQWDNSDWSSISQVIGQVGAGTHMHHQENEYGNEAMPVSDRYQGWDDY